MLREAAQAAAEAAKQGSSITVAIPTAFVTSAVTIIGRELVAAFVGRRRARSGNGSGAPKPGTSEECLEHRDRLTELETKQEHTDKVLDEVKADVKELLRRVPPK